MFDLFTAPYFIQDRLFVLVQLRRNDQRDWLADDFFGFISEQFFGAAVPAGNCSVQVLAGNGIIGRFHDRGQAERIFLQLLFLRDVSNNLRRAYDPALLVFDGRNRQGNIDEPAILVHAHSFKMFDPFTRADLRQYPRLVIVQLGRDD